MTMTLQKEHNYSRPFSPVTGAYLNGQRWWEMPRCPVCRRFAPKQGKPKCERLHATHIACPRCNSLKTIKMGFSPYGIQIWHCNDCKRRFREIEIKRDYAHEERHGKPTNVIIGHGVCQKCRLCNQELANGLCLKCYDTASKWQLMYYRRKFLGLCTLCGKSLDRIYTYCSECYTKTQTYRLVSSGKLIAKEQ